MSIGLGKRSKICKYDWTMKRERHANPVSGNSPGYRDIYQRIRSEILSGRLAAGVQLPSSRTLASELGVARGTVVAAFQMLAGEGYIVSDGARGTIVSPALPRGRKTFAAAAATKPGRKSQSPHIPSTPLLFQMGLPALAVFPRKQWTQIATRVARQLDGEQMMRPQDVMGYEPLRRAIASYLRIARDISCSADQILITSGFQGALAASVQALLKPGDKVCVENPGYFFARDLLQQLPLRLVGATVDEEGVNIGWVTATAHDAALALVTPTHQFPLGMTLPVDRRLALLDWADRRRAWIVEDDYDCEFHHRGLPPPALKSLDRSGRVLYAGSFSKVLFPGLRLGYLVLPSALVERFECIARAIHLSPALMIQKSVEGFMAEGHFARHLSRMRTLYTERRNALAAALAEVMPEHLEIKLQNGGMHFVARLRGRARDSDVAQRLRIKGIGPSILSRCYLKSPGSSGLLIGYTNVASEDALSAARRLLAAMR